MNLDWRVKFNSVIVLCRWYVIVILPRISKQTTNQQEDTVILNLFNCTFSVNHNIKISIRRKENDKTISNFGLRVFPQTYLIIKINLGGLRRYFVLPNNTQIKWLNVSKNTFFITKKKKNYVI